MHQAVISLLLLMLSCSIVSSGSRGRGVDINADIDLDDLAELDELMDDLDDDLSDEVDDDWDEPRYPTREEVGGLGDWYSRRVQQARGWPNRRARLQHAMANRHNHRNRHNHHHEGRHDRGRGHHGRVHGRKPHHVPENVRLTVADPILNDRSNGMRKQRRDPKVAGSFLGRNPLHGLFQGIHGIMEPMRNLGKRWQHMNPFDLDFDWDFGVFSGRNDKAWYDGPNVCESREETEEEATGDIERHQVTTSTVCDETNNVYKCTVSMNVYGQKKTVTVSYQCCYGFQRVEGKPGCPEELNLKGLVETAEKLELNNLIEAVQSVQLADSISQGNYTVFAPTDAAFGSFVPMDMPASNIVMVSPELMDVAKDLRATIAGHVLPGFVPSSSLIDEGVYDTIYPKASIRINIYNAPTKMLTANCVPIKSADHLATNGIIHTVDKVLPLVSESIIDIVSKDPDFSTLKTLIGRTGLVSTLSGEGQFTVLAPTNAAFAQLNDEVRDYLLQANSCLKKTLQAHVLKNVICSSVIQGRARTANLIDEWVMLNRTDDGKVFVGDGSQVVKADIMATNGVIHIIDKVIVPQGALNIIDIAKQAGTTAVLDLVRQAGLTKTIKELDNFSMFLPTNEAIERLPEETKRALQQDPVLLSKILRFHIVPRRIGSRDLYNSLDVETLNGDKKITVKEYASFPFGMETAKTVQCAPIVKANIESCNAVAHVVDKVLVPPVGDVLDVIAQDGRFSRLSDLLKRAGLAEKLQLSGPFTMFAPTDEALSKVDPELLRDLAADTHKLAGFLAHHVTQDTLCCAGMLLESSLGWWWNLKEMTLDPGSHLVIKRKQQNVLVDDVPILTCDLTATNGVVHAIEDVLPSAASKFGLTTIESPEKRRKTTWLLGL